MNLNTKNIMTKNTKRMMNKTTKGHHKHQHEEDHCKYKLHN